MSTGEGEHWSYEVEPERTETVSAKASIKVDLPDGVYYYSSPPRHVITGPLDEMILLRNRLETAIHCAAQAVGRDLR